MDALIRSAAVAEGRLRLGSQKAATPPVGNSLREQIERQVRGEIAEQLQQMQSKAQARAHAEGHAAGLAEGRAAAATELTKLRDEQKEQLKSATEALERAHEENWSRLQSATGEIAFAAVCRLIGSNAGTREFVLGLVEQACASVRADGAATARMHPRDVTAIQSLLQESELRVRSLGLSVVEDESLRLGGCVIEAASGEYDGGLENQLRRLHSLLTGNER